MTIATSGASPVEVVAVERRVDGEADEGVELDAGVDGVEVSRALHEEPGAQKEKERERFPLSLLIE
ncbi:MAG TPA: hypothetical protein VEK15_01630 [Vicinamibacteria bacterium]|nr:hypothetical protein [Vicinamibacteria bacterium]